MSTAEGTWPNDVEPLSREQWMTMGHSKDPNDNQQITSTLKKLGYKARDFVMWPVEDRVEKILEHQPAAKSSKGAGKKTGLKKGKAGTSSSGGTNGKSMKGKAGTPTTSSNGTAAPSELSTVLKTIVSQQKEILERLTAVESALDDAVPFIQETHFGFQCMALGDEAVRSNFEDAEIQEEMLGTLAISGGEEEEGEEEEEEEGEE